MADIDDVKVTSKSPKKKTGADSDKKMSSNMKVALLAVVAVVAVGAAIFFWNEAREANSTSDEAIAARNAEESEEVLANLDKVLLTESEDDPTVARVEDPQLLKEANPDFYKNVEEGDHLILYPQRAIIFRNVERRVINVAPIIDTSQLNTDGANNVDQDEN